VLWLCHIRAVRGAQSQAPGIKWPLFLSTCTDTGHVHIHVVHFYLWSMLYKRMALTSSGVRSPAVGGGYLRGVPQSFRRTLTVPARSHANVD